MCSNPQLTVALHNIPGLCSKIPKRIERIAFCRQYLLEKIQLKYIRSNFKGQSLLFWIDLDSSIGASMIISQISESILLLSSNKWSAIFPFSYPFYYDLLALKADNWNMFNPLIAFRRLKRFTSYLYAYKKVFLDKQLTYSFSMTKPFSVRSAFGGAAIYSLPQAFNSAYCRIDISKLDVYFKGYCEHITYHKNMQSLYINPGWLISAPKEHIKYKSSILWRLLLYFRSFFYSLLSRF